MLVLSAALIGAAVAQDAFAASAVYGTADRSRHIRTGVIAAAAFALFQTLMPVLGWSIGRVGSSAVEGFDHIIAFGILCFIGIKMMLDSRSAVTAEGSRSGSAGAYSLRGLFLTAFATSIDALTMGITLPASAGADSVPELLLCVTVIGAVTFIICMAGYLLGRRFNSVNPTAAQLIGGAVLIALGIKTLLLA